MPDLKLLRKNNAYVICEIPIMLSNFRESPSGVKLNEPSRLDARVASNFSCSKVSRVGLGNFVKQFAKSFPFEIGVDSELRKEKEPIASVVRNLVTFPSLVQGNCPD
jgi:hypothetical protein